MITRVGGWQLTGVVIKSLLIISQSSEYFKDEKVFSIANWLPFGSDSIHCDHFFLNLAII